MTPPLLDCFASLPDPRIERNRDHPLVNILFIALCACLCGADDFVAIEEFGKAKRAWFSERLDLRNGIPSHDTFGRVFARLDPTAFQDCFHQWTHALRHGAGSPSPLPTIALDGKTLRHSFDQSTGKAALHLVSAFAGEQHLVLGQQAVEDKSNEITAIPALLERLDIAGCLVTIDAMGTQKAIARQIVEKEGDYILALKDNHPMLCEAVEQLFPLAAEAGIAVEQAVDVEKDHGRIERRCCQVIGLASLAGWEYLTDDWEGLRSLVRVERNWQECAAMPAGMPDKAVAPKRAALLARSPVSTHVRYFLSSLSPDAALHQATIRSHWRIENGLHWILDMAFLEDASRARRDHAPVNLAMVRHLALNLLQRDRESRVGVKNRRLRAGWDDTYREALLTT